MREIVSELAEKGALAFRRKPGVARRSCTNRGARSTAPQLDKASEILQSVQRDEQIDLNQRVREQEWATQSTQVLDFLPRLERAAYEMQKEERGLSPDRRPGFYRVLQARDGKLLHLPWAPLGSGRRFALPSSRNSKPSATDLEIWIVQCAVPEIETKRAGEDAGRDQQRPQRAADGGRARGDGQLHQGADGHL